MVGVQKYQFLTVTPTEYKSLVPEAPANINFSNLGSIQPPEYKRCFVMFYSPFMMAALYSNPAHLLVQLTTFLMTVAYDVII